jgi:hypothetical protein
MDAHDRSHDEDAATITIAIVTTTSTRCISTPLKHRSGIAIERASIERFRFRLMSRENC